MYALQLEKKIFRNNLLLGFSLKKKSWPHSLAPPLSSVAGICDHALWPGSVIGYCSPLVFSCPALLLSSLVAEQLAMSIPTQIIDTAMCDIWPSLGSFAWLDNYVLFECSLGPTIHQGMKALINLIKFKNKQCAIEKRGTGGKTPAIGLDAGC